MKKLILIFLLISGSFLAQDIPDLHQGITLISEYVSSKKFTEIKKQTADLAQVDSIYNYAVKIYYYDYSEAMLALTFALVPYKEIPLKLPLFGISWNVPLPCSADSIYLPKNRNLPQKLFPDSPSGNFGDRDKLSHFFGNAFLSFNISLFNFSEFIGIFIELFEETFKIEGALDQRDLIANELGKQFGEALQTKKHIMPSEFFRKYDEFIQLINKKE